MTNYNAKNERIKREFFRYLREAKRQAAHSVDIAAKAIDRFELFTKRRDFARFNIEQASAFKRKLAEQTNTRTGKVLSPSTQMQTLAALRVFPLACGAAGLSKEHSISSRRLFRLSSQRRRLSSSRARTKGTDARANPSRSRLDALRTANSQTRPRYHGDNHVDRRARQCGGLAAFQTPRPVGAQTNTSRTRRGENEGVKIDGAIILSGRRRNGRRSTAMGELA